MATPQYVFHTDGLTKAYPGGKKVFENIRLSVLPGVKIGVVGVNGSGKSTLLRIMAGLDKDFQGEAWAAKGINVGYLPQEPELDPALDVRGNVMEGVAPKRALLDRYNEVAMQVAEDYSDALMEEMTSLQDQIDAQNLWDLDSQADVKIYGPGNEVVTGPPYRRPAREWFRPQYRHGVGAMTILPNGARINLLTGRPAPLLSSRLPISGLLTGWINAPELFVACRVSAQDGPETRVWESWTGHLIARRTLYISELAQASLSPDGRFVYAGNRLHDSIAVLSVSPTDGTLTYIAEEWTRGSYPRSFGVDPAGRFLYCCNQRGDNIACFRVDAATG